MKKKNWVKYVSVLIGGVVLMAALVNFMQLQAEYVRAKDEKQVEIDRMSVSSNSPSMDVEPETDVSEEPVSFDGTVSEDISALLSKAQVAVDDVSSMQMEYPELLSQIGRKQNAKDADAKAAVIALREERLKPYFPNDSWCRERWFSEHESVDPILWQGYVADQLNDGLVPVIWSLTDKDEHVLMIVSAFYDGATNTFVSPDSHWTSYGTNAVAFTGNGDFNEDNREIDEFIQSVQEIIGLPDFGSNGGSD